MRGSWSGALQGEALRLASFSRQRLVSQKKGGNAKLSCKITSWNLALPKVIGVFAGEKTYKLGMSGSSYCAWTRPVVSSICLSTIRITLDDIEEIIRAYKYECSSAQILHMSEMVFNSAWRIGVETHHPDVRGTSLLNCRFILNSIRRAPYFSGLSFDFAPPRTLFW
jgi:hypothetical protein